MWACVVSVAACQSLTGLSDLDPGEQTATSAGGTSTGGGAGAGGEGDGGEGEGDGGEGGDGDGGDGGAGGAMCGEPSVATCDDLTCMPMCADMSMSQFLDAHCVQPCDMMNPACAGNDIMIDASQPVVVPHCTACAGKTVTCDGDEACIIDCTGMEMGGTAPTEECFGTTFNCGGGPCEVICDAANCDNTTVVNCGDDACRVTLGGSTPTVNCNTSCDCDEI